MASNGRPPSGRPPVWTTVLVVVGSLCVVALGLLYLSDRTTEADLPDAAGTSAPVPSPSMSVQASPSPNVSPEPTPEPTSTPVAPVVSPVVPDVSVDVLNQSAVSGLAARAAAVLADAGWTVGQVDDATLGTPSTTLYVPVGLESAAASFVEAFPSVGRTRPAFEGLSVGALTLVLAQPDAEAVVVGIEGSAADVPAPVGAGP